MASSEEGQAATPSPPQDQASPRQASLGTTDAAGTGSSATPQGGKDATNPQRLAFLRSASVPTLDTHSPRLVPRWVFAEGKNWVPFGIADSTRLEEGYQELHGGESGGGDGSKDPSDKGTATNGDTSPSTASPPSLPDADAATPLPTWRVPVGEDRMLEVDLRPTTTTSPPKLHSIFWKSPPVDVRRGEWFFESSRLAPCEIELSQELSQLYAQIQPWTAAYAEELKASASIGNEGEEKLKCKLKSLKGSYVIFSGSHLARIYNEGVSQRLAKTLLTAWSGEHGGGTLVVRGYDQVQKLLKARKGDYKRTSSSSAKKPAAAKPSTEQQQQQQRGDDASKSSPKTDADTVAGSALPDGAAQPDTSAAISDDNAASQPSSEQAEAAAQATADTAVTASSSTFTTGMDTPTKASAAATAAAASPQSDYWKSFTSRLSSWGSSVPLSEKMQRDISESFRDAQQRVSDSIPEKASEVSAREARASAVIEATSDRQQNAEEEEEWAREREAAAEEVELVICWHGIGQKLAEEWKGLEFSLAVNSLKNLVRKKSKASAPSSIGGEGFPGLTRGKRLAFLPINWRATLNEFQPTKDKEDEANEEEHLDNQVGLDDIFGRSESIPLARSITKNLLLDIPLFLSHHREEVLRRCVRETNRAYALFCQRNPDFRKRGGKVSMVCHSLGAVLAADVLSSQPTRVENTQGMTVKELLAAPHLAFDVRSLYLCGSPSALFFYLQSRQLIARRGREMTSRKDAPVDEALDRPIWGCLAVDRIWNVFNSTDPVGTCLNGCVDTRLAKTMDPLGMDRVVQAILATLPGARALPSHQKATTSDDDNPQKAGDGERAAATSTSGTSESNASNTASSLGLFGSWSRSSAPPSTEALPDLDDADSALGGETSSSSATAKKTNSNATKRESWANRLAQARKKAPGVLGQKSGDGGGGGGGASRATEEKEEQKSDDTATTGAAAATYPPAPVARDDAGGEGATEADKVTEGTKETDASNEGNEAKAEEEQGPATSNTQNEQGVTAETDADAAQKDTSGSDAITTRPAPPDAHTRFDRAHRRMLRLNPLVCVDYMIPKAPQSYLMPVPSSMLEYVGMLQAHATYLTNESFAEFLVATIGLVETDAQRVRESLWGRDYEGRWEAKYCSDAAAPSKTGGSS